MQIGIIGASGNLGQRLVTETVDRGHQVRAFTRDLANAAEPSASVVWATIDVLDADSVTAAIGGLDVLVSAYQPGNAAKDLDDVIRRSISDPSVYATAANAMLKALDTFPSMRLIVVGGAGSLEVRPGVVKADLPDRMRADLLRGPRRRRRRRGRAAHPRSAAIHPRLLGAKLGASTRHDV